MATDKKTSSVVMEKIEKEHVEPKPRWTFLLKNYIFWGLGIIALVVGSVATSVIIFTLANSDWDVYHYLNGSLWKNVIIMLPYLWFVFFGLFAYAAYYNIRHTKHGYRYGLSTVIFSTLAVSIIIGFGIYHLGFSHTIDNSLGKLGHRPFLEKERQMLVQPEKGILAGVVTSAEEDGSFKFKDFNGKEWTVSDSELREYHKMFLENASEIIIIGEKTNDDNFKACALRPMRIHGENKRLRYKMRKRMEERGIKSPEKIKENRIHLDGLKKRFEKNGNFDERRLLHMRSKGCGDG